jgi:hypothetical protein
MADGCAGGSEVTAPLGHQAWVILTTGQLSEIVKIIAFYLTTEAGRSLSSRVDR